MRAHVDMNCGAPGSNCTVFDVVYWKIQITSLTCCVTVVNWTIVRVVASRDAPCSMHTLEARVCLSGLDIL